MTISERAGKPADPAELVNPAKLATAYYAHRPDAGDPAQQVAFGTSGHRGSAYRRSFNEAHILATTQAICEHRAQHGIDGPLFLAKDTHALSEPALVSALEVLAGNAVEVRVDAADGYTPTPALSHAILRHNQGGDRHRADGIVVTPSHNPPEDGGFKYNPPNAGPADSDVTDAIQQRANALLAADLAGVRRLPYDAARAADTTGTYDFLGTYVNDLPSLVDLEAVRAASVRLGADPLGGASVAYWQAIAERYELDLEVVNDRVDPTFGFMPLDWDGRIRMDCSSPYAMANLVALADDYDVAFGNDADADRHGIVAPGTGLMNPNHYLAVAIHYLFTARPDWPRDAAVGKTLVSSSMIDRVAADLGRELVEVPVGFKWFVPGLLNGSLGFGAEESAGATFLRRDGQVWTTDKDGIALCLLAAEITAVTGQNPAEHYRALAQRFGAPAYARVDAPATREQKAILKGLAPRQVNAEVLGGDPVTERLTAAAGNQAAIGGLKVTTDFGWFAARPSGTEDVYKIYAESFRGDAHLQQLLDEARAIVSDALAGG